MSQLWADRQRRTNKVVRILAEYIMRKPSLTTDQMYGLCRLTWITVSFDVDHQSYISSTKIPALGNVLSRSYAGWPLSRVADDVANIVSARDLHDLLINHTGFTNLYPAYRNSCRSWIEDHHRQIEKLFRRAIKLETDDEGQELARLIGSLPPVYKANTDKNGLKPENLLTPVVFSLDKRIRFPLINGDRGVQKMLSKLGVSGRSIHEKYARLVEFYGQGGIQDAADLDQVGLDLIDFVSAGADPPTKKLLEKKPVDGNALTEKLEDDIEILLNARKITHRRAHNRLTNAVREAFIAFKLLEGCDPRAKFDILIRNYNGKGHDLLIEAKSTIESAHIRLAVGQLFDYRFQLNPTACTDLAILTPEKPSDSIIDMLKGIDIGVLWIEAGRIRTCSQHLEYLCLRQSHEPITQ